MWDQLKDSGWNRDARRGVNFSLPLALEFWAILS